MELLEKAQNLLRQAFPPPAEITLSDENGVFGVVRSPRFIGVDIPQRQDMLWESLDKKLDREERQRIISILALAPHEGAARLD
jgi:hypothetical protein